MSPVRQALRVFYVLFAITLFFGILQKLFYWFNHPVWLGEATLSAFVTIFLLIMAPWAIYRTAMNWFPPTTEKESNGIHSNNSEATGDEDQTDR